MNLQKTKQKKMDYKNGVKNAKMTDNDEDYNKYMNVSNTLMEMFTKEIQNMKV